MPTLAEGLTPDSSDTQAKAAVSDCIAFHVRRGMTPDEAAGKCYGMAENKRGKPIPRGESK